MGGSLYLWRTEDGIGSGRFHSLLTGNSPHEFPLHLSGSTRFVFGTLRFPSTCIGGPGMVKSIAGVGSAGWLNGVWMVRSGKNRNR